ncbi:MAG: CHASE2 domain-containing protein [Planctomycetota bacterium]|jgi:adenylate cyclase
MLVTAAFIIVAVVFGLGIYFSIRYLELNSFAQRFLLAAILTVSFTTISLLMAAGNIFESAELSIYDAQVRYRGPRAPHPDIVICSVDKKAKQILGSVAPVPRAAMARVITNLADAGASVIGIDYTFSNPNRSGSEELAAAIEDAYCVILAMSIQSDQFYFSDNRFREGAVGEGMINVFTDRDGYIRYAEYIVAAKLAENEEDFFIFPSFELASLQYHLAIDNFSHIHGMQEPKAQEVIYDVYEQNVVGQDEEGYDIIEYGKIKKRYRIPKDGFYVNYVGPSKSFNYLSLGDVYNGNFDGKEVEGKIVFIGDTRLSGGDVFDTPFNYELKTKYGNYEAKVVMQMPGIEIHANMLASILDANEPEDSPRYVAYQKRIGGAYYHVFLLCLGLALGVIFCFLKLPVLVSVGLFIVSMGMLLMTSAKLFAFKSGIFMPLIPTAFLININFVGGTFLHWLLDRMRTRSVIGQWGRYMSKNIVEKIVSGDLVVNTSGHEKELTLLFSDIRGFTTASEGLGPEGIARLLNAFFNRMITCVFDTDGTMDKLMGDCIMAFWNDPVSQPDHRKRACETALNMMAELKKFRDENPVPGADKVDIGIGLNSGPATVGDLGADFYSDYTALGDTVNTASRLEGINKYYRSNILISEETYTPVKEHFEARHIDTIRVKGREKPVKIFELLCRKGEMTTDMKAQAESFEATKELYKARDWEGTMRLLDEHLKKHPNDGPAQTLRERADDYRRIPPPSYWDGVYDFETK